MKHGYWRRGAGVSGKLHMLYLHGFMLSLFVLMAVCGAVAPTPSPNSSASLCRVLAAKELTILQDHQPAFTQAGLGLFTLEKLGRDYSAATEND